MAIRKLVSGISGKVKRLRSLRQTFRTGRRVNGELSSAGANKVIDPKTGKMRVGVPASKAKELRLVDGGDTRKVFLPSDAHRVGEPVAYSPKAKKTNLSGKSSAAGKQRGWFSKLWTREPGKADSGGLVSDKRQQDGTPLKSGRPEYNKR